MRSKKAGQRPAGRTCAHDQKVCFHDRIAMMALITHLHETVRAKVRNTGLLFNENSASLPRDKKGPGSNTKGEMHRLLKWIPSSQPMRDKPLAEEYRPPSSPAYRVTGHFSQPIYQVYSHIYFYSYSITRISRHLRHGF